jgi:hypothetical protein
MGLVDRGANRRLDRDANQTANRGHKSDFGLTPMLLGDQEDIEIRPHRAAHVGHEEIDRVERERGETLAFGFRFHRHSHSVPIARVIMVRGAPTLK